MRRAPARRLLVVEILSVSEDGGHSPRGFLAVLGDDVGETVAALVVPPRVALAPPHEVDGAELLGAHGGGDVGVVGQDVSEGGLASGTVGLSVFRWGGLGVWEGGERLAFLGRSCARRLALFGRGRALRLGESPVLVALILTIRDSRFTIRAPLGATRGGARRGRGRPRGRGLQGGFAGPRQEGRSRLAMPLRGRRPASPENRES